MKDEVKQYIDDCIIENPDIDLNNLSVFTQPDELHYLANVVNWDIHIPILDWIVKQAICSEATALMIFWQAQPQDFTVYKWNATRINEDIAVFQLIKVIITNYTNGFYLKTDLHYNPIMIDTMFLLFPISCIKTLTEKNHIIFMMKRK
ncbi:DUF4274 domain-containing protein [Bacteroides fragilis]|nr:DUF4274 domain-containing protein [Bacteroides fragilis]